MKRRCAVCLSALALTVAAGLMLLSPPPAGERLPGAEAAPGRLVRIWVLSSVGGGESWLRACLKEWEAAHPGVMTYLRGVTVQELYREDAVLPDILLYTPGDLTAPQGLFTPLRGMQGVREAMLRCGRWRDQQYGLPLCYGGYVLAIDGQLEPLLAATPAPTTLLGRPAATSAPNATATPGFPLDAARQSSLPLACPRGAAGFTLSCLLSREQRPSLEEPAPSSADVYRRFLSRQTSAALLTTGQLTALESLAASGKGPAYRVITPSEVITDQVWLGSLLSGAGEDAASLLASLIAPAAQRRLASQGLYTVRDDLKLYAAGIPDLMERAAARSLTSISAYIDPQEVDSAAWRVLSGLEGLSAALMPLL